MNFRFPTFLVGGAVRDQLMGLNPKDLDYVVLAPSFDAMEQMIVDAGGEIFQSRPEFLVTRANHPELGPVDFAVARADGEYSDGRRPDSTAITTDLKEDLARRDLTINAMARNVETDELVDPFGGKRDLEDKLVRAVGDPDKRLGEDKLRAFRALRFALVKEFDIDLDLSQAINALKVSDFDAVSTERIKDELDKMFKFKVQQSFRLIDEFPVLGELAFEVRDLWVATSMKKR
jgi:tRNA nucleotidyltransferase (CCA-adding enzyme)